MNEKPNILFIFSDQQHWQAMGFEDATFNSPNLDRVASEGTVFTESFCTTPQCSPSRSSMMTGLYPSKTGVIGNIGQAGGTPLKTSTIGVYLQNAGYRTAYYGKWHLGKDPLGIAGWDDDFGVTGPETGNDTEVTHRAIKFLQKQQNKNQPFALFLSYKDPHDIYHFSREVDPKPSASIELPLSWQLKDFSTVPEVQSQFMREDQGKVMNHATPKAWERYRELYREKVKLYDDEVGKVLKSLENIGKAGSTLLMLTSDHGDMDTHHRLIYKGPFMYEQMMRVPMIIRLPGYEKLSLAPRTLDFPTVNVDIAPTIADFAGITLKNTDGLSLKSLLTGQGKIPQRDFIIGEYFSKQQWINPIRMIRDKKFKYNLYAKNGEELYDMKNDPSEIHNLAKNESYQEEKAKMVAKLEAWMQLNADPFPSQSPTTRDGKPII